MKVAEAALNVTDPRLNIKWPLEITELSERDRSHPMIKNDFEGIVV
jgi:dTDP-4-dehydrorhamnose 3,5-epimerase